MLSYYSALITIATPELSAIAHFYTQLLQQQPNPYLPNKYAEFNLKGLRLGIFVPKAEHQTEFAYHKSSNMSICIEVETIESAIAHLTQLGFPPTGNILTASHGKEIYAYDPLGNRLILHQSHKTN